MWRPNCATAAQSLDEWGLWSVDGGVSPEDCSALRTEILALHSAGLLRQSGNVLAVRLPSGQRVGRPQPKPHVYEADVVVGGAVERPDVLDRSPTLRRLLAQEGELRRRLNEAKPGLELNRLEQAKVQVNDGEGGAFPFHFDVPAVQGSSRHLTAILYLNSGWQDADGGELESLPFPFPDVALAPLAGRLVAFSALGTMHRVRPFRGSEPRVCVNLWFDGNASAPFPLPLPPSVSCEAQVAKIVSILRQRPTELRAFCKLWYRDTIAGSFREAFGPSPELEAALALHAEEAGEVEARVAPKTLALLREAVPLAPGSEPEAEQESGALTDLFDFE